MFCNFLLFSQAEISRYSQNIEISTDDCTIVQDWYSRIENQELIGELQNYLDFYDQILRNLLGYQPDDRK